jgi:hypothetical protein
VNDGDVVEFEDFSESGAPAVDEKEALRQSIERNEADLREAVEELTAVVKSEVTLGGQITERPIPWLVGGFAIGVLFAWRR